MKINMIVRTLLFSVMCSACTHHIDDVEFLGLEPYDASMTHPARVTWLPASRSLEQAPTWDSGNSLPRAGMLRVRFRTHENLTKLESAGDYIGVSFCPYNDEIFIGGSSIFAGGYQLGDLRLSTGQIILKTWENGVYAGAIRYDGPSGLSPIGNYFYYEGFFDYKSLRHFDAKLHKMVETPLPSVPRDLCFKIKGVDMLFPDYDSNEARIPYESLEAALKSQHK